MRPLLALVVLIVIAGAAMLMNKAGRALLHGQTVAMPWTYAKTAEAPQPKADGPMASVSETSASTEQSQQEPDPEPAGPARPVAPAVVAPPQLDASSLERTEPREPLSTLSQALPPRAKVPGGKDGTVLYRPVATASSRFEAMGYQIVIAGTQSLDPAETCTDKGRTWPCGVRARTAFRSWLRGRALTCAVPPQAGNDTIAAGCNLAGQDAGEWLVSHGWARAVPGGPYADAETEARQKRRGIFGPPPSGLQ